ncbi:MAG TPA: GNAT family N-acetyltransferase [Candidatus Acidoferrum sp.]
MSIAREGYSLRLTDEADIPALRELIETSVRVLQREDYSTEQIEAALGTALGVDTQLIADRTYYAAETELGSEEKLIVACGGWSRRKTLFGSDHGPYRESALLNPQTDAAKIRAFFVHPEWVRMGIATKILETCEKAARDEGFHRFEMGATLTGVPMYLARGYTVIERIEVPLPGGLTLPVVRMGKSITEA